MGSLQAERAGQFCECGHQLVTTRQDLNRNMVGTRGEVFLQPGGDGVDGPVGDEGVDHGVATRHGDVGVGEPEPLPVVGVVRQVQVDLQRLAADLTGPFGGCSRVFAQALIRGQDDLVLGSEERVGPDQLPGLRGVLGCGQVRVRPRAAPGRQLQDLRSEGSDHAAILGHAVLVELVQVFGERVVRLLVLGVGLGVADADAEEEPVRVGLVDAVERLGDRARRRRPDVDDAGRELQLGGGVEDGIDPVELSWRGPAGPDGPVSEGFDFPKLRRGKLLPL